MRRWLAAFGPGTLQDLAWWTGWPLGQTRQALAAARAVEVDLDAGTGFLLADDLDPVPPPPEWVALLPSLDPTVMGWKERSWYLGGHRERLFDRNGNAGPTVWADGRVVGGWAQRPDGTIAVELLEPVLSRGIIYIATHCRPRPGEGLDGIRSYLNHPSNDTTRARRPIVSRG